MLILSSLVFVIYSFILITLFIISLYLYAKRGFIDLDNNYITFTWNNYEILMWITAIILIFYPAVITWFLVSIAYKISNSYNSRSENDTYKVNICKI